MVSTNLPGDRREKARRRAVLYIMTFIMGGCGIAYEYTFSKISSDLMGNSVRQWAVTIGLMMFFMGVGSDLQKYLKDRHLFDKFILFEVILGVVGGFGPVLLLWVFGEARDHYVLLQYGLIIFTGFLIGLEIPILARVNENYTPELRVNIGGILRMDYIGAFVGAVFWVFLFLRFFNLTQTGFVLGIFNLVTAGLSLWYFRGIAHRKALLAGLVVLGFASLVGGFIKAPEWTYHAEQKLYMDRIIYSKSTKYQHIVLTQSGSGDIFCYINGNTQFSSFDEHIYHEFLTHPAMAVAPRRAKVLVLGGGDGLAVREILKYADVDSVTLVDIDPDMTRLAHENEALRALNHNSLGNAKVKVLENNALRDGEQRTLEIPDRTKLFGERYVEGAEVTVVHLDAAQFVDQISGVYDVIVIDFPDPSNLELSKLYSRTFYNRIRSKLSRGGMVVQQSSSPVYTKEAFLCVGRTMEAAGLAVVPFHENVPTFGEWGWWLGGRAEDYTAEAITEKLRVIEALEVETRYLTPDLIRASLVFGRDGLNAVHTEVNTLLNNVIYTYYADALATSF